MRTALITGVCGQDGSYLSELDGELKKATVRLEDKANKEKREGKIRDEDYDKLIRSGKIKYQQGQSLRLKWVLQTCLFPQDLDYLPCEHSMVEFKT